jgi:hypothetical protein
MPFHGSEPVVDYQISDPFTGDTTVWLSIRTFVVKGDLPGDYPLSNGIRLSGQAARKNWQNNRQISDLEVFIIILALK